MIAGFGKPSLLIGSAPHCDIRLGGTSVSPEHARLSHDGLGKITFLDLGHGKSSVDGSPLAAGSETPFDFRHQFVVGSAAVPNSHPAIAAMLMQRGQLGGERWAIRDRPRSTACTSCREASQRVRRRIWVRAGTAADHRSWLHLGTWISGQRLAPQSPTQVDAHGIIAIGPVPLSIATLMEIANELNACSLLAASGTSRGSIRRRLTPRLRRASTQTQA